MNMNQLETRFWIILWQSLQRQDSYCVNLRGSKAFLSFAVSRRSRLQYMKALVSIIAHAVLFTIEPTTPVTAIEVAKNLCARWSGQRINAILLKTSGSKSNGKKGAYSSLFSYASSSLNHSRSGTPCIWQRFWLHHVSSWMPFWIVLHISSGVNQFTFISFYYQYSQNFLSLHVSRILFWGCPYTVCATQEYLLPSISYLGNGRVALLCFPIFPWHSQSFKFLHLGAFACTAFLLLPTVPSWSSVTSKILFVLHSCPNQRLL